MDGSRDIEQLYRENLAFKELKDMIIEEFGSNAADDNKISRFLIARDYEVVNAYTMLKEHLEWRKRYKIDTILEDYHPTELFQKYYSFSFIGFSKEHLPIIVTSFGRADFKGFMKAATKEEVIRHFNYIAEVLQLEMKKRSKKIGGRLIDKCVVIADMEGLPMSHFTSKIVIETGIELAFVNDRQYPESLDSIYIINTSSSFQILVSIFKPFVATKTYKKFKFYGKEGWKEDLLKIIDPEVLPAYLGGERTDPDGNPMCPSSICHPGTVPERFYFKHEGKSHFKYQPGVESQVLKRGSKLDLPLVVKVGGSSIEWEFEIDNHDIGFGLFYKVSNSSDDDLVPLIPLHKYRSSLLRETGTFKCEKRGIYVLMLDNSHSFFRSKTIYYKASVVKPDDTKLCT